MDNFKALSQTPHLSVNDFVMTYPPPTPKSYTVSSGDTCVSIALRLYGDASFGSAIASMNGLTVDEQLVVGQILQLPQYLPETNNANNATPYERFMTIMIGSLYPHLDLKQPPPPKPHHSGGFFGSMVHAFVDTVAGVTGFLLGGPLVAGLFEGLADAAYQGVAVECGWQDHFSLRAAFTSAIETSLSIGILGIHGVSPSEIFASLGQMELQAVVEKTALIAVTGQLTEMATGLRDKFDFGEVLTQVGTAVVMHAVAPAEDKLLRLQKDSLEEKLVTGETSGLVGGELNHLVNHQKVDIITITGSTIGSSVGSTLGAKWSEDVKDWKNHNAETPSSYQQMQKDSANNNTSNSYQSSQNPGRNKSGFFNSSNSQKNQTSVSNTTQPKLSPQNTHKTNYFLESPDEVLKDSGVDVSDTKNSQSFWNQSNANTSSKTSLGFFQTLSRNLSNVSLTSLSLNPLDSLLDMGEKNLELYGIENMKKYVGEHGSVGIGFSIGYGPAIDVEFGFSKQGITRFFGIGVGLGVDISLSANYDFQNTSGFTSRTSLNMSLGAIPVQVGGSFMVSQIGTAYSLGAQLGEGWEIATVVGYTSKTSSWDEVENNIRNRVTY